MRQVLAYTKLMVKKTVQKAVPATRKLPAKKASAAKKTKSQKVDYYPNRVPFLVAVMAAVTLVALAFIVSL